MDALHLAVGLDEVQAGGQIGPYVRVEVLASVEAGDRQQGRVGDGRGVVGAALAVLAARQLVDALGEPGVDPADVGRVGPLGVDAGEGRADQPAVVRRVDTAGRESGTRRTENPPDRAPQPLGGRVRVLVEKVPGQGEVDDGEGGVRRGVGTSLIPQAVLELLLGEDFRQFFEGASRVLSWWYAEPPYTWTEVRVRSERAAARALPRSRSWVRSSEWLFRMSVARASAAAPRKARKCWSYELSVGPTASARWRGWSGVMLDAPRAVLGEAASGHGMGDLD